MQIGEWNETKKEYERGELVKVTTEFQKKHTSSWLSKNKDTWDFVLRIMGIAAVFIPFLIFINQQKAENRKQKALLQVTEFTSLSTSLDRWDRNYDNYSAVRDSQFNEIVSEHYKKIVMLSDSSIIRQLDYIINYNNFIKSCAALEELENSVSDLKSILNVLPKTIRDTMGGMRDKFVTHSCWSVINHYSALRSRLYGIDSNFISTKFAYQELISKALVLEGVLYDNYIIGMYSKRDAPDFSWFPDSTKKILLKQLSTQTDILSNFIGKRQLLKSYGDTLRNQMHKLDSVMINASSILYNK